MKPLWGFLQVQRLFSIDMNSLREIVVANCIFSIQLSVGHTYQQNIHLQRPTYAKGVTSIGYVNGVSSIDQPRIRHRRSISIENVIIATPRIRRRRFISIAYAIIVTPAYAEAFHIREYLDFLKSYDMEYDKRFVFKPI